jgi:hypothetical protein
MNGDEVVEFEFGYETPFVAEMSETRQHFFYFFTMFFCLGLVGAHLRKRRSVIAFWDLF